MRTITSILMVLSLLIAGCVLAGEEKVNFTGEWSFNQDKSETDGGGRRRSMVSTKLEVKQEENKLAIKRTGQNRDGEEVIREEQITLDGKENELEGFGGRTSTVTAKWSDDGKTLTITSLMVFERQGSEIKITSTDVWALMEDGKVLSINSTRSSSRGERKSTLVYDKIE